MEEYEDDGTWVWTSFAPECRLVIAHVIGERKQYVADDIIGKTKKRLSSTPLYVSDGLKFYANALLKHHGHVVDYPPTHMRGRPRLPELVPDENLRYAQVIKHRKNGHLAKVEKRVIFGRDIDLKQVSTSLMERQNLTFRQDNNRISRKTLGFSKKLPWLDMQMTLYFGNFNFCRGHGSLEHLDENGVVRKNSPAKECGLIDHNWTLDELLTFPYYITSTN